MPNYSSPSSRPKQMLAQLLRDSSSGLIAVPNAALRLGLSTREAAIRLGALARAGWLARVRRGLYYAIPLEAESSAVSVPEDPWVLADTLFAPCYIGGWTAATHWELTEQLFQSTFVVTAAAVRQAEHSFAGLAFHVSRTKPERLEGTIRVWRGRGRVAVSDRERTIVDALVTPSWVGGIRHVADIITQYAATNRNDYKRLLSVLDKVGTGAARKRFAFLAESLYPGVAAARTAADHALRNRSSGIVKLDPAVRAHGTIRRRWGIAVNVVIPPTT